MADRGIAFFRAWSWLKKIDVDRVVWYRFLIMLRRLCGVLIGVACLWAAAVPVSAFSADDFIEKLSQDTVLAELESSLALSRGIPSRKKAVPGLQKRIKEEKQRVDKLVKAIRPLALKAQHKQDVNVRDSKGRTLLMLAAEADNGPAIDYLLSEEPDLNAVDQSGRNALDYDESRGGGLLITRLLSALEVAFQAKDYDKVRRYCKAGIAPDSMLPGGPLVGRLLMEEQCELAIELCRGKKIENEAMLDGTLVSELIVGCGNEKMLQIGAEMLGKELWRSSPGGTDALLFILRRGNLRAVQFYAHHFGFGNNLCMLAVRHSTPEVVAWVLKQAEGVGKADSWGSLPLFEAARRGDLPVYQAVLAAGADVAARNDKGETLLMHAALGGNVHLVNAVLDKLPQELLDVTDAAGRTAADYARMSGVAMVESLLATRGLSPQAK